MPKKIQGTFELPKVREVIMAVGEKSVKGFLEFELTKLAERINVSGNLTPDQTDFIADQLMREFPNETLADFKLCFERGASGAYGKIWKLDGVELGVWMRGIRDADGKVKQLGYLDEKYQIMQDELMKQKDNQWQRAKANTDWLKLWQESIEKTDKEGGVKTQSQNMTFLNHLRSLTDKELREQGQVKPKAKAYKGHLEEAEHEARRMLTRAASEFYKNKKHGFDLKSFSAPFIANGIEFEVEFMAESESDAIEIYNLATK
jgi:hypothetical protein